MANRMHEASFPRLQGSRTKESRRATKQKRETERERRRKRRRGCKGRPKHPEQTEGASKLARAHIRKARTKARHP